MCVTVCDCVCVGGDALESLGGFSSFFPPSSLLLGLLNGHAAFLLVCLQCDLFTFVSLISVLMSPRFGACTAGVRPFRWPCSISVHLSAR